MAEIQGSTGVSWAAVSAAVALLTARQVRSGDGQADLLGGQPPGEVIAALVVVAVAFLEVLSPGDGGAAVLRDVGWLAAAKDSGGPV